MKRPRALRTFLRYWPQLLRSFRRNAQGHWPIFAALLMFPFLSGEVLYMAEAHAQSTIEPYTITRYWDAVYVTWITMSTVGFGDKYPVTPVGRIVVSVDALVGLILVGLFVSLFSTALRQFPGVSGRPQTDLAERSEE